VTNGGGFFITPLPPIYRYKNETRQPENEQYDTDLCLMLDMTDAPSTSSRCPHPRQSAKVTILLQIGREALLQINYYPYQLYCMENYARLLPRIWQPVPMRFCPTNGDKDGHRQGLWSSAAMSCRAGIAFSL
jgi:hypothetical protein